MRKFKIILLSLLLISVTACSNKKTRKQENIKDRRHAGGGLCTHLTCTRNGTI